MKKTFCSIVITLLFLTAKPILAADPMLKLTPSTGTYTRGSTFEVVVGANTGSVETQAIDVWLKFDPAKVEIESVTEVDNLLENLGLQSGSPNINITDGKIDIIIYPSLETHPSQKAVVNGDLLKIKLKPKIAGTINFDFICIPGESGESSIFDGATLETINCASNINGVYTITDGGTVNPDPTAVPTTSPNNPTATPTTANNELPKTGSVETTIGLLIFGFVSLLSSLALKFL